MRRPFPAYVSAALAAALVAMMVLGLSAGCGSEERDYGKDLVDAAAALAEAGSAHILVNAVVSPPEGEAGMTLNVQGDAWADLNAPAMEARFTVLGMELSFRYVGGEAFLRVGGSWYSLAAEKPGGPGELPASLVAVLKALPEILASTASVERVGEKRAASFDCVELEVRLDAGALVEREAVRGLAEDLGLSPAELEDLIAASHPLLRVCIQKGEPVIRQVFLAADVDLSLIGERLGSGLLPEKGRLEVTADLPEHGVEVSVEPPAEARPFEGL